MTLKEPEKEIIGRSRIEHRTLNKPVVSSSWCHLNVHMFTVYRCLPDVGITRCLPDVGITRCLPDVGITVVAAASEVDQILPSVSPSYKHTGLIDIHL